MNPEDGWSYTPSCPCDRCEDHRWDNGMSCMYGIGPRPGAERRHRDLGEAYLDKVRAPRELTPEDEETIKKRIAQVAVRQRANPPAPGAMQGDAGPEYYKHHGPDV